MLGVLLALGTWQMQRLHWKEAMLARLEAAAAAPPVPLTASTEPYTRVTATGRFDHAREALLGLEVRNAVLGSQLVTPLLRDAAPPLLVLRGWVPLQRDQGIDRPEGPVTIIGYIRPGEVADSMAAKDDTAGRRFYTFNPRVIGDALGLRDAMPFGLVALGQAAPGQLPQPAAQLPQPTNPHLGYALTWYGLAATLVGVLGAFLWSRRKGTA